MGSKEQRARGRRAAGRHLRPGACLRSLASACLVFASLASALPLVAEASPAAGQREHGDGRGGRRPAPIERRSPPPPATSRPSLETPAYRQPVPSSRGGGAPAYGPVRLQGGGGGDPARPNQPHPNSSGLPGSRGPNAGIGNGQHLPAWLEAHHNLPLAQQQRALEAEPGFARLRPEVQQRMRNRLTELNQMSPDQRAHVLARTEQMERLSPEQRAQVRGTMQQLGTLPQDRRQAVSRAFRQLRSLPPNVQQSYLNSPAMHTQFTDTERGTLSNLLNVAPYLPPPNPPAPQR